MESISTGTTSLKSVCRLCTAPTEAINSCSKCQQIFCAQHLQEHTALFQKIFALLNDGHINYYPDIGCNMKKIKLFDEFMERISQEMLLSLVSNLAVKTIEVGLTTTKIPLKVEAYITLISKPKNITGVSRISQ